MALSLDLSDNQARPYFLWSEAINLGELREILAGAQGDYLRWVYSGRILREAAHAGCLVVLPARMDRPELGQARSSSRAQTRVWQHCLAVWANHGRLQ